MSPKEVVAGGKRGHGLGGSEPCLPAFLAAGVTESVSMHLFASHTSSTSSSRFLTYASSAAAINDPGANCFLSLNSGCSVIGEASDISPDRATFVQAETGLALVNGIGFVQCLFF